MISVGVANNLDKVRKLSAQSRREKIVELIKEAKRQNLTGSGSNTRKEFEEIGTGDKLVQK